MLDKGPNANLIGKAGSRRSLMTPALVVDVDAMDRNIDRMAQFSRAAGVSLRPHAKTHKSVEIARRQIAAGALGISVATVGEAEALAAGGIDGLLVTSPVVGAARIARLIDLNRRLESLSVVADNAENVEALAGAARAAGKPLSVLVDVDTGSHRTGVPDAAAALRLARTIADDDALEFGGVQAYAGHLQHIEDYGTRRELARAQSAAVESVVDLLKKEGLAPRLVTGAGTGTHELDAQSGVFTELQAGSYIFTDVEYNAVALTEDVARPFEPALFVLVSVISTNAKGFVTTDGGLKRFATDGPMPEPAAGAPPGSHYRFMGDEHGAIVFTDLTTSLPLGATVECLTPHCDPTVNLYDVYHVASGDRLVDIWPVDARGAI